MTTTGNATRQDTMGVFLRFQRESECQTNLMMGRLLLLMGIIALFIWALNEAGTMVYNRIAADIICWTAFVIFSVLFFLCELKKGRRRWLRPALAAAFLLSAVIVNLVHGGGVSLYLLLVFCTTGYCNRRYTVGLSMVCTCLMTLCTYSSAFLHWHYDRINTLYFKFPENAVVEFNGWRAGNLADYMTAQSYAVSYMRYYCAPAFLALLLGCICSIMVVQSNFALLNKRHMLERQRTQAEIDLSRNQVALMESNSRLLVSQIQPHFIYNVLNSIYHLCEIDSTMAQEAISDFSDYLRTNLNALSGSMPVPFTQERTHIETYLRLEKMRFGPRIQAQWDVQTENFNVPELSVQPIVENAVKHGLCPSSKGGTVWISTRETEKAYQVVVKDDGVGFDASGLDKADGSHVGFRNVRSRLEILCHASLQVDSAVGQGTTVTISVPKEEFYGDTGH